MNTIQILIYIAQLLCLAIACYACLVFGYKIGCKQTEETYRKDLKELNNSRREKKYEKTRHSFV